MVYGAREPGNIRVVQLNASSGRLPHVALPGHRPGDAGLSNDNVYHHVARSSLPLTLALTLTPTLTLTLTLTLTYRAVVADTAP